MKDLHALQAAFKQHLFAPGSAMERYIVSDRLDAETRLAIYANAYYARLAEALQSDYPVVNRLVGEREFNDLAADYAKLYPSSYASLRWFGKHFPAFLSGTQSARRRPCLVELARLEWALVDAFLAAEQPPLSEADLAEVPARKWPSLRFAFHPSVQSVTYQWNVLPLWNAINEDQPAPEMERLPDSETCLVWRRSFQTKFRTLGPEETQLFKTARDGGDFSRLCEQLSEYCEELYDVPVRAAGMLKSWVISGLITGLSY